MGMEAWLGQTKYLGLSPQLKAKIDEIGLKCASVTQKVPFEYHLERIDKGEAQHGTKRAPRQGTAPQYIKNAMSGVRTHDVTSTADLKSAPFDLSGIIAGTGD